MTKIQGVYAALVTPRAAQSREIDLAAALDIIDYLGRGGLDGIAVLGSTGEFLHFDFEDRLRLIQFAVRRSRLPVVVNVSHSHLDAALQLGQEAASLGAAALLLMPPYFFPYGQDEIREFYLRFAAGIGDAAPVFLYNAPEYTSAISAPTAVELLATGRFAGIKDSGGEYARFEQLKNARDRNPFTLLVGNDCIFTRARSEGADGVISGVGCAAPELMVGLDRAIMGGDAARTRALDARLSEFLAWLDRFPTPVAIKEALAARGLRAGPPAVPLSKRSEALLGEFREWFPNWLSEVRKETAGA